MLALQRALIERLRDDGDIEALVGVRVYDVPPDKAVFPYVRLGNIILTPVRTDGRMAWDLTFSIESHSRAMAGRVEATEIGEAVVAALDNQHRMIGVIGFRLAWVQFITATVVRADDGKSHSATAAFDAVLDVC